MDKIKIKDLEVFANHGVFPEENTLGQKFIVSADLYTDTRKAGKTDDLTASIHYGEVSAFIEMWLKKHTYKLLESAAENLAEEHLCCIIRSRKAHPGVETKRRWLAERLKEGHVFRKLDAKATVFVEYAPLEAAWVPIVGDNYIYIYSRGQRAKRTCSHVHLATAARVKYPDACVRVFDFILFLIAIRDRNDFRCLDRCLHQFVNLLCQI